jgi:hypothetical protein
MKYVLSVFLVFTLLLCGVARADHAHAHAPYQTGVFEKKAVIDRAWVWTVSVGDTLYDLHGAYGDAWLSEMPIGSKVEITVGGKHNDRAWIHFEGKNSEASFIVVGTSVRQSAAR